MDTYDSSKPIKSLLYLDANSLYPTAMSMPLPIDQFEFAEDPESIDFANVDDDAEFGYIFEVDGLTPEDKHDLFNDYPLIPEKMRVDVNKLSALQRQNLAAGKGTEKLGIIIDICEVYRFRIFGKFKLINREWHTHRCRIQ